MVIFKNFLVAILLAGVMTRIANWIYQKKLKKIFSIYLSFFTVLIVVLPCVAIFLGFDVVVAEYVLALILWLFFDLMRVKV